MKVNQPLYLSLYEKLKNQIIEGQYQSNDRFPSKRQLSNYLSVSHTTIEHAYQLLVDEGFIYSKIYSNRLSCLGQNRVRVSEHPDVFSEISDFQIFNYFEV